MTETDLQVPQWWIDEGRLDCEHAGYADGRFPGVVFCRCLICFRCKQHTGNNTQGHHWAYCKVTRLMRKFHFCCPNDCELEASE